MAAHWRSITGLPLVLFFHNQISSVASSRKNQIPNRTTASSSHGSASPTCCPVVDDPARIALDVSPPNTDGSVYRPRSTRSAGSSQVRTSDSPPSSPLHPIAVLFQRQQLGKAVLGFAVAMATGLLFNQYHGLTHMQAGAIAIALSVGFAATLNGILLQGIYPRVGSALQFFGASVVLITFYGLMSSFVPPSLVWACWVSCASLGLPVLLCLALPTTVEEANRAEPLGEDIV